MTVTLTITWTQVEDDKESTYMRAEMVAQAGKMSKLELAEAVGAMALIRICREIDMTLDYSEETLACLKEEAELITKEIGDNHTAVRRSSKYRLN